MAAYSPAVLGQGQPEAQIEEIIVTSQKREQALAEIPMSVSVLSGDLLEQQRAFRFEDLVVMVPGFSITGSQNGFTRLTLRGINTGGVASTVGVYLGDVPFGSSNSLSNGAISSADFDTFDMARVEVLRGPQGTLYGASSLGGVIKYVPNAVSLDEFEGNLKGSVETVADGDLGYSVTGAFNVPVNDRFGLRAAAYYRSDDGFIDSIGNNPIGFVLDPSIIIVDGTRVAENINTLDTVGGRVTALFQPTDNVSIELMALAQNIESGGRNSVDADSDTLEPLYGTLAQASYHPDTADQEYRLYSVTVDWDFGGASLQSVTSYSTFLADFQIDGDLQLAGFTTFFEGDLFTRRLGLIQLQNTGNDKFTQELRLLSADSDTFEWLVGAYYTQEDSRIVQDLFATESGTDTIATGVPQLAALSILADYEETALFANATWYVTSRFELSVGVRASDNEQLAMQDVVAVPWLAATDRPPDGVSSESPFTWSFAPRFKISDDTSIYARVATGFRPGGPNVIVANAPPGTPSSFDSDELTSYELGLKTTTSSGKFSLDTAVFYLDWEDIQLFARINDIGVNTNGGTAFSRGAEFLATLRPSDGLSLSLNGAYTDAQLTANTDPLFVQGVNNDPLPYVPEWSLGLNANKEFTVMGDSIAYFGGTAGYIGDRSTQFNNRDPDGKIREAKHYVLLGLRGGIDTGRWSFEVYGRNLFDEKGSNSTGTAGSLPNGGTSIGLIRPRTFGMSFGMRFD